MREYAPAAYNIISLWAMRSRPGVGGSPCCTQAFGDGARCRCAAVRARCPRRLGEGTGMAQHASGDRLWPVSWMAVSDRFNVWREKFGKLDVQTLCAGFVRGIAEFAGLPSSRGIDAFRVIRRRQA
jgi:hypothetical protein